MMSGMHPTTFLADLRATQQRQRATLEIALGAMVSDQLGLEHEDDPGATELQVRLAAAPLLAPYTDELAAFELVHAQRATRRMLSRYVHAHPRWAQTAADSIGDRFAGGEERYDTHDPELRDKFKALRDALALLQAADIIGG